MNNKLIAALIAASISGAGQAQTLYAATVTLDGDWYLQAGEVMNQSDAGISVTGVTYSMGAPEDGVGVWEDYLSDGRHADRLAGSSTHYSTQVWNGLQLASQSVWTFGGLDLDRIVHASTGQVDSQNLDFGGASLRYASVMLTFSDGYCAEARLAALGWDVTQVLHIGDVVTPVPEPAQGLMLLSGLGMVLFGRRKAGRKG
ncbi:PEP-CTERM sorting domain-containing protein [uncultured Sphaerotilus sp.]|uniref:PEP-CTERM sorting domain-containing protein n=1 Tax=uncultured Sphaerotilus sp. TaxID=474984 RepID=UPI0030CA3982